MSEKMWTMQNCDDFQGWQLRTRRAAPIRCDGDCGAEIEPGDAYAAGRLCIDGRWQGVDLHAGCWSEHQRQAIEHRQDIFYEDIGEGARDDGMIFDLVAKVWVQHG
jgi:hypothetical protein